MEHKCKNCFLFNRKKMECKVAILIEGEHKNLPVFPEDFCHLEELQIPVDQVRWFEENEDGKKKVKIEYPEDFFEKKD
jgi:hypothetical protein